MSWFLRLLVPCGATGRSNAETQRARKGAQVISHPLLIAISDPRLRISPQLIAITGSTAAKQFATDREQENPDPEQFATDPEQGEPDPDQSATDHEQEKPDPEQSATDREQEKTDPDQSATDREQGKPDPDH